MDLTGWFRGVARPCPLVVTAPGGTAARLAVERALRELGWPEAPTPAAADMLVTCGTTGPGLAAAVEALWQQIPAPRTRVHIPHIPHIPDQSHISVQTGRPDLDAPDRAPGGAALDGQAPARPDTAAGAAAAAEALTAARTRLLDTTAQREAAQAQAAQREGVQDRAAQGRAAHADRGSHAEDAGHADDGGGAGHADGHISPGGGHGGHPGAGADERHGGHAHDGHGGMEMPAGLAMADRADDRDGLRLDQLHVPLGPVLPDWPAGLVVHAALQGDVVQRADVEVLDADVLDAGRAGAGARDGAPFWDLPWLRAQAGAPVTRGEAARWLAAAHLDSLARLLGVAGWAAAALAARRCRDDLLAGAGADTAAAAARFARLARRVRRSRTLRWLTDGLGVLDTARAAAGGVGEDVTARWVGWLDATAAALREVDRGELLEREGGLTGPRGRVGAGAPPSQVLLELLPELVTGTELAAARLIVASLDPDPDQLTTASSRALPHG